MTFPMSRVIWIDAMTIGDCNWGDLEEMMEDALTSPPTIVTIGFVLHECDSHISLTETIGPAECGHMTKIPKGMIVENKQLTVL